MKWIRHTSTEDALFPNVFALYRSSFPKYEQRKLPEQAFAMQNPKYHCESMWEKDTLIGLLFWWQSGELCYVEHFAISPASRGQGYGSLCLKDFCQRHSPIVLEIDPPEETMAVRRLHFYTRLGFVPNDFLHLHPPYQSEYQAHRLQVLSYPGKLTRKQYQSFWDILCNQIMGCNKPEKEKR